MESAGALNIFVNHYKGAPRGRSYEAWREETCRQICGLDIQPSEGDAIDCRIQVSLFGGVGLAAPDGTSAKFSRIPEVMTDGCDNLVLVGAKSGRVRVTQKGREIELSESQMCLTDMSVPGSVGLGERSQFVTTRIPRAMLLAVHPRAEDKLSQVLGKNDPLRETIARYHALAAGLAPQLDAVGQQLVAQHVVDLVALLLDTDGDRAELARGRGDAGARFDLMRSDVLASLDQRDLNIATLAQKHGLSARQAQRLFEQAETTFTEFLLEQRLLLARKLLLDPLDRRRKISDVAQSAGFSDLSYFNRAFRKRFGMTPSELRDS